MMLGNTRDETRGFYRPGPSEDRRPRAGTISPSGWRPSCASTSIPNGSSPNIARLFPAYTPEQIFYAATTAGRSWRGQVIEAEARARGGRAGLGLPARFHRRRARRRTRADIPLVFGTLDDPAVAAAPSEAMMDAFLRFARDRRSGLARAYTTAGRDDDDLRSRAARRERSAPGRARAVRPHPLHPAGRPTSPSPRGGEAG